jgi:hypothetical protein
MSGVRVIALFGVAAAIACGSDSPADPTTASLLGDYSLTTVNGGPLPFAIAYTDTVQGGAVVLSTISLLSERFSLSADRTFRVFGTARLTVAGGGFDTTLVLPDSAVGRWSVSGNALTITIDGDVTMATIGGHVITRTVQDTIRNDAGHIQKVQQEIYVFAKP